MNDPLYHRIRETAWRRRLTASEEAELRAWLAAHPDARADWEDEAALNEALRTLGDAPVPSNFTARVLRAVERESRFRRRSRGLEWNWFWRAFVPKAAVAAAVLGLGLFSYQQYQAAERAEIARGVAAISPVAAAPNQEFLKDFDAIRRLGEMPDADVDLLALLE